MRKNPIKSIPENLRDITVKSVKGHIHTGPPSALLAKGILMIKQGVLATDHYSENEIIWNKYN